MLSQGTERLLDVYCEKNAAVAAVREPLRESVALLCDCFERGGKLLICGNGGSCADADHIVGEFAKAFKLDRPLMGSLTSALQRQGADGVLLAKRLQGGWPAINLGAHSALLTAIVNDVGGEYIYAQQTAVYGRTGDVLLGISTSGNSRDVLYAGLVANAKGMKTIGLTGKSGGEMKNQFGILLRADAETTEDIQDIHSVIYHAICACVEYQSWGE